MRERDDRTGNRGEHVLNQRADIRNWPDHIGNRRRHLRNRRRHLRNRRRHLRNRRAEFGYSSSRRSPSVGVLGGTPDTYHTAGLERGTATSTSTRPGTTSGVVAERESSMAGKFELYKDAKGKFRFRLKAGNGEIIAVGEAYDTKASAKNGIASVQKNAPDATVVDLTE